ncbi:hypothetical protein HYS31_06745 [Candidatus Woesearchaeota archaeon]|nr:hypothetical protein [Candidatus Woesearchaeota archaeon]
MAKSPKQMKEDFLVWWKDIKLLIGLALVVLNFVLGFYAKVMMVVNIKDPFYWKVWVGVYAISWLMLFAGIYLLGFEGVKLIKANIKHNVKKTISDARKLPQKSVNYGRKLHKKSVSKIKSTSKFVMNGVK